MQAEVRHAQPILVVDDQPANLVAMEDILADLGPPVVCAASGEEALRLLLHQDFSLILLDVRMPGIDGYETATLIRQRARSREVPIIFMSAVDKEAGHQFRGYAAGAVDFIFKPVDPMILRAKIKVFIDLNEKAETLRRQAEHERELLEENLRVRAEQLRTAEKLRSSLHQQSLVLESLPIALFVAGAQDLDRTRRFIGGNLEGLLRPGEHIPLGEPVDWSERIYAPDRERFAALEQDLAAKGAATLEYRVEAGDGVQHWLLERVARSAPVEGGREEVVGFVLDITPTKSMEEMLMHAQKLDSIGEMTSGIAHDFNNMLGVIIGTLDRVTGDDTLNERTRRRLDLAMQAALSCADLTKRMLAFARRQSLDSKLLMLPEELARLEPLIRRAVGPSVQLRVEAEPVWPIRADASQLEAALLNLAVNARDAMLDGGALTFALGNRTLRGESIDGQDVAAGDYVEICVTDTGTGMSEEVKRRALEPFFTTKGPGKGTGLGLSSIFGFVRQSGGALAIDSRIGEGTSIRLLLPRAEATEAETTSIAARGGKAREIPEGLVVLLVEDDELLRESTCEMLATLGCDVRTATHAAEALEREAVEPRLDLLFTDIVMPGEMDGRELAREIARRRAGIPIVLTSGNKAGIRDLANATFVPKPYSLADLKAAISGVLCKGV